MKKNVFLSFLIVFSLSSLLVSAFSLEPDIKGKADFGALALWLDVLENGKTDHEINMYGARSDATILFFKDSGLCLKPFGFGATGNRDSSIYGAGVGVGHYTPIWGEKLYLTPVVGVTYTDLRSRIDLDATTIVGFPLMVPDVRERFCTRGEFVAIELMFWPVDQFSITAIYQYAWSHTETTLTLPPLPPPFDFGSITSKGTTSGSNYAVSMDYYFIKKWCLSLAAAYNSSLDEARFGIEGYGFKLSIGHCFY